MGFQIGKVQGNTGNILFTYWNVLVVSTILDTMMYNYIYTSFTYVLYKIDSNFPEGLMFPAPRTNPDFIPSVRRHVKWSRLIRFYPNTSFDEALVTSHFHVDFLDLATVNSECIPEVKVVKVRLWIVTSFSCQGVHASMQACKQASKQANKQHSTFLICIRYFQLSSENPGWLTYIWDKTTWLYWDYNKPLQGSVSNSRVERDQILHFSIIQLCERNVSFGNWGATSGAEGLTDLAVVFSCSKFISFSAARCLAGALRSREDPLNGGQVSTPRSIICPTHFEYIAVAEWFPDFCSEAPESRTFSPKLWRCFLEPFSLKLRSSEVPDFFSEALKLRISKLQDFKASRHR